MVGNLAAFLNFIATAIWAMNILKYINFHYSVRTWYRYLCGQNYLMENGVRKWKYWLKIYQIQTSPQKCGEQFKIWHCENKIDRKFLFAFLRYLLHFNGVSFVFNKAVKIVLVLKVLTEIRWLHLVYNILTD